ncbi:CD80-like immunoglobulin C2-set [Trinorchestia longiramus]|nr:CD80-like immunoglobulin C2-set [Trinorchestia longiramus]
MCSKVNKQIPHYCAPTSPFSLSYDGRAPRLAHPPPDRGQGPHLTVSRVSASLTQPVLTPAHTGLYECRVDFFRSPTHVNLVNLTVIEPPSSVAIVDNHAGASSRGRLLGPYPEGSQLTLSCLVTGGIPTPNILWQRDGSEIKIEAVESSEQKVTRSDLKVSALPRSWNNANVTCSAWNSDLTHPISASVTIHMYLSASSVVVQGTAATVSGQLASLQCWARGSTPPATLSWAINGQPLHPHREESSITEGVSTSEVEVKVTPADNGAVVSCSAINPAVDTIKPPTNTTKLVVYYPPTVSVEFGLSIEVKRLKEGDDVYLRCKVSANPPPDKITWFHEDRPVLPNRTRGIIMSGDSLALQKVDRHMAGQYRCAASNHLANATSRPLPLKLAYKPVCMMPSTTTYFIYDQPINVTCHIASHPPATRIDWYWNSGNDIISLQPTSSIPETMTRRPPPLSSDWDRSWARLSVRPSKHQEDRQLSCWANNIMGRQEMPCRFFIRVAQTPAPVSSCRLANITASSVSLTCVRPPHPQPGTTQYFAEVTCRLPFSYICFSQRYINRISFLHITDSSIS